ncbi:DUF6270 domain-containing protein [Kushneria aurantia]|uniref:DUF6270 domain-containing protein n=1 Tax=Kushneria aurantia TaxID=504092 RepID=A0ABV6G3I6_9GAMM|nr:DUF6270 domain-containing protein [Kushneria aurantia]
MEKKRILVFGGCISRDIFNYPNSFELSGYFARSSLASVYSGGEIIDNYSHRLESSFQRRSLENDLKRNFRERIKHDDYDILLMDLINMRFDLFVLEDGCVLTLSNEAKKSGVNKELKGRRIKSKSQEYQDIWRGAFLQFINELDSSVGSERVRVTEAYLASCDEDGNMLNSSTPVSEENFFLAKQYRYIESVLGESALIKLDDSMFVADPNHRWGVAPFHYKEGYYLGLVEALKGMNTATSG